MFTVVIPLYNKAHTIERAVQSVLLQTFNKYELIIVNDGSSDEGVEIVKNLTNDPRVIIIEQENQGVSAARNKGVSESQYDYIAFLDADDEWEPKYLETMHEALVKYPEAGMICSAGFFKDHKTGKTNDRVAKKYKNTISKINYFENPHVFTHSSATVVSKKDFDRVGGFPIGMKKNEDFVLFYSLALISETVYSGYPLSYYYYNVDFQTTQVNKKAYLDVCKRLNLTYTLWDSLGRISETFEVFLKYELRHILLNHLKNKDYGAIKTYMDNLDQGILTLVSKFERYLYQIKPLNKVGIAYILSTKSIWRMRGYPRVGEK